MAAQERGECTLKLTGLPNIGPVLADHLQRAGVGTAEELRKLGAEEVFLRVRRQAKPDACLHELEALAGAAAGVRKSQLPPERKRELTTWFRNLEEGDLCLK